MSVEMQLREALMVGLEPIRLDVVNAAHQHAGHASSPGTGESHFSILIVAPAFTRNSRVERHRLVTDAVGGLLKHKVHALAIKAYAPGENIR